MWRRVYGLCFWMGYKQWWDWHRVWLSLHWCGWYLQHHQGLLPSSLARIFWLWRIFVQILPFSSVSFLVVYINQEGNKAVSIDGYEDVGESDSALLCATVQQPISVGIDGSTWDFQLYTSVSPIPIHQLKLTTYSKSLNWYICNFNWNGRWMIDTRFQFTWRNLKQAINHLDYILTNDMIWSGYLRWWLFGRSRWDWPCSFNSGIWLWRWWRLLDSEEFMGNRVGNGGIHIYQKEY